MISIKIERRFPAHGRFNERGYGINIPFWDRHQLTLVIRW